MAKDPTADKMRAGAVDANKWRPPVDREQLAPVKDTITLPPVKSNPFDDPPETAPIARVAPSPEDDGEQVGIDGEVSQYIDKDEEFDNLKLDVTEIDDVLDVKGADAPAATSDIEVGEGNHPCGLPLVLMDKERLVQYLKEHGVTKRHRDSIEYTETERRLYEIYKTAKRNKRTVTKAFFTTSLRMYRNGMPLNIEKSLDLNKMKIGE